MSGYPQNTYVGMRYVPLFDGEWDATKDYEPLTVVSIEGNSYTSRTFVPAGISPVGNPEYWAETGNYNAQIEAYRQEVLQYNDRIQANADAITTLEAKEDADIGLLKTEIAKKETDVFSGKIICIGDSYLNDSTVDGAVKSWGKRIKELYPNTIINGEGGAGFSNAGYRGNTFKNLINDLASDDSVSLVLIGGCYNDSAANNMNYADVYQTFLKAFEKFPNAKVYAVNMGVGTKLNAYGKYKTACTLTKVSAEHQKFLYLDITAFLKVSYSEYLASDGIHPSNLGSSVIANAIINTINGGGVAVSSGHEEATGTLSDGKGEIKGIILENDANAIYFKYYNSWYASFDAVVKEQWLREEICTITIPYNKGKCADNRFISVPFPNAHVKKSNGKLEPACVWIETTVVPDVWSVRATVISDDGLGYYNGGITGFSIEPTCVALPLIAF